MQEWELGLGFYGMVMDQGHFEYTSRDSGINFRTFPSSPDAYTTSKSCYVRFILMIILRYILASSPATKTNLLGAAVNSPTKRSGIAPRKSRKIWDLISSTTVPDTSEISMSQFPVLLYSMM